MNGPVRAACVQAEPVIFDRDATIVKLGELAREAASGGAALVLLPETFVPVYPSNRALVLCVPADIELSA